MKKEALFSDDFLKQFKTGEELELFLSQLHKRGIEKMLDGELDVYSPSKTGTVKITVC